LTQHKLPSGAVWFDQGWTGSLLAYDNLVEDPEGLCKHTDYYQRVFALASPLLSL